MSTFCARPLSVFSNRGRDPALAAEVGATLTHLLGVLPADGSQLSEVDVTRRLAADFGDSEWAVRNAIAIAGSGQLIVRERHGWRSAAEVFRVFSKPPTCPGGHQSCRLKLTELGQLWKRSKERDILEEDLRSHPLNSGAGSMHVHGDFNLNQGQVLGMGSGNTFTGNTVNQNDRWRQAESIDTRELAEALARLVDVLEARATETEHYQALGQIDSARRAAERGDKETALSYLAKLGELAKWAAAAATAIGVGVATQAILIAMGHQA
jgi:hypothetical protein